MISAIITYESAGAPWIEWCHECPDAQVISAIAAYDLGDYYL